MTLLRFTFLYVTGSHGTMNGHGSGSTISAMIDVYNPCTDTWNEEGLLPSGIVPRGHTGAAYVAGKICVASGRRDSEAGYVKRH
jgi:hypothetical protein